jgi:hypothetical protein
MLRHHWAHSARARFHLHFERGEAGRWRAPGPFDTAREAVEPLRGFDPDTTRRPVQRAGLSSEEAVRR